MTAWKKGIAASVTAAFLIIGGRAQLGHYASASEDHNSLSEAQETQDRLVELTEVLANRVQLEDAEAARDVKLCQEGIIEDAQICRTARLKMR